MIIGIWWKVVNLAKVKMIGKRLFSLYILYRGRLDLGKKMVAGFVSCPTHRGVARIFCLWKWESCYFTEYLFVSRGFALCVLILHQGICYDQILFDYAQCWLWDREYWKFMSRNIVIIALVCYLLLLLYKIRLNLNWIFRGVILMWDF